MPAPAPQATPVCPGLRRGAGTLTFTDCLGRDHDLLAEPLKTLKQAAPHFGTGRSYNWLRGEIKAGRVYPVLVSRGGAMIEVYDVAIRDWKARQMLAREQSLKSA